MIEFFAAIPRRYVDKNLPSGAYLVSAGRFWNPRKQVFDIPSFIPQNRYFIDSGAYSFQTGLPYSWEQYLVFAMGFSPVAISTLDVFGNAKATVQWLEEHPEIRSSPFPVVPVITGSEPGEYRWCLERTCAFFDDNVPWLMGVGALKGRRDIRPILKALDNDQGIRFHLFGASIGQLKQATATVFSCDNGSWNGRFGKNIDLFNAIMRETKLTQKRVALEIILPKYRKHPVFHAEKSGT